MLNKIILFLAVGLLTLPALAQNTLIRKMNHDGRNREYRIYIPSIYDSSTAVPLVFNLHGLGSNNQQQELYGDFRSIADTANFILVHPNGTLDNSGDRFWDAFNSSPIDDLGFLSALIDTINSNFNINLNRVYSTGMSNGGFMSHQLACQLSERIAAIASVTGSMRDSQRNACQPNNPMPVMQIHGTADPRVPYSGGMSFLPVDSVVQFWVGANHCNSAPTVTQVPNTDTSDGSTAEHFVYNGCDSASRVELYKVIGGGHTWPGAPVDIGPTNHDFDASKVIWEFFRQFSRPRTQDTVTSVQRHGNANPRWEIFPNPARENVNLRFADSSPKTIIVVSELGEVIRKTECNCSSIKLQLPKSGVYFVRAIQGNSVSTKKALVR